MMRYVDCASHCVKCEHIIYNCNRKNNRTYSNSIFNTVWRKRLENEDDDAKRMILFSKHF